jgi:hypothetical protein
MRFRILTSGENVTFKERSIIACGNNVTFKERSIIACGNNVRILSKAKVVAWFLEKSQIKMLHFY